MIRLVQSILIHNKIKGSITFTASCFSFNKALSVGSSLLLIFLGVLVSWWWVGSNVLQSTSDGRWDLGGDRQEVTLPGINCTLERFLTF